MESRTRSPSSARHEAGVAVGGAVSIYSFYIGTQLIEQGLNNYAYNLTLGPDLFFAGTAMVLLGGTGVVVTAMEVGRIIAGYFGFRRRDSTETGGGS
jgi:hypothetical protein